MIIAYYCNTMNSIVPNTNRKRIVIVGGGFGGIRLAKSLRKLPVQVVLLDSNNYHTFQPLLYQVATGGLEPDSIAFPLRKLFGKQDNFFFRMGKVEEIHHEEKELSTSIGPLSYDYLVIATGTRSSFYGMETVEDNAYGMKTVSEAVDIRSIILENFEKALYTDDKQERERLLQFVVVGGGPTGVETAGALAELKRFVLPNDYPELDLRQMDVHLIEAGDHLLGGMSDESSENAKKSLEKLGVHIWFNTYVKAYNGKVVTTQTDKQFHSEMVMWAAGIEGSVIPGIPESSLGKARRIKVNPFNQIEGMEDCFALGDVAFMETEAYPHGFPQVAQVAIQQGKQLASNFKRLFNKVPLKAFEYKDKGSMATIGRNKAVVDIKGMHLRGIFAWLVWMLVHLIFLMGFRNKLVVFINWVWSYLTYDKGSRIIIRPFKNNKPKPVPDTQV